MKTLRSNFTSKRFGGWAVGLPSFLLLSVLVLYPLLTLLLQIVFPHLFDQHINWTPSWRPVFNVLSDKLNMESLLNSLLIGIAASILATIFGTITAFGAFHARGIWKIVIDLLVWVTLFAPSYVIAQGWLIFMQDNGIAAQMFGLGNGWSAWFFTRYGLVLTMGLRYLPFVHLAMIQAVENLGDTFQRAGRSLGASRWTIFRRITLPLLTPALLAGASIAFAEGFGDFGFAAAITPETHIPLLSYQIYAALNQAPVDYSSAAVLSFFLLAVMGTVLWLQMWWMRKGSYETVSSHTSVRAKGSSRSWQTPVSVVLLLIGVIIPTGATVIASLWKNFSNGLTFSNWTFHHYVKVVHLGSDGLAALERSLSYSFIAAVVTMVVAIYVAYQIGLKKSPLIRAINIVTMATIAVPGVVLAAGFIFAWNALWLVPIHLVLYGTPLCLAMAYIAGSLPYAIRLDIGAFSQLSPNLMKAAQSLGARQFRILRKIVFPLISSTLLSTFFLTLTGIMFELPASSLLYPAGAPPFPVEIASYFNNFDWSKGSALTIIGMVLVLTMYGLGRYTVAWMARRVSNKEHAVTDDSSQRQLVNSLSTGTLGER